MNTEEADLSVVKHARALAKAERLAANKEKTERIRNKIQRYQKKRAKAPNPASMKRKRKKGPDQPVFFGVLLILDRKIG